MTGRLGFTLAELDALLDEFLLRLEERGVTKAEIQVAGGAALLLGRHGDRVVATDLDMIKATPADPVMEVIAEMAAEHGLAPGWANHKARMYAPDGAYPEPEWIEIRRRGELRVVIASPRTLFAMKLHAARGSTDIGDLDAVADVCGFTSRAEAVEVFEQHYPAEVLKARATDYLDTKYGAD